MHEAAGLTTVPTDFGALDRPAVEDRTDVSATRELIPLVVSTIVSDTEKLMTRPGTPDHPVTPSPRGGPTVSCPTKRDRVDQVPILRGVDPTGERGAESQGALSESLRPPTTVPRPSPCHFPTSRRRVVDSSGTPTGSPGVRPGRGNRPGGTIPPWGVSGRGG